MKQRKTSWVRALLGAAMGGGMILGFLTAEDSSWTSSEWEKIRPGISYMSMNRSGDRPLAAYLVRVETKRKNLSFVTTPPAEDYEVNKCETIRQTTAEFLSEHRLILAVNANFYNPFNAETQRNPGPSNLCGAAVCQGITVSPPEVNFPVFTVTSDNFCEIRTASPEDTLEGVETAVAGNQIILQNGEIVETGNQDVHPRTALGISADKKYVYFLVIDGRQKGYSVGATYAETAEILQWIGASDGINLDGGGSTTLAVAEDPKKNKKKGPWPARVINHPVGQSNQPGTQRYNGNNIGIKVRSS